jgi:hypothetical protein
MQKLSNLGPLVIFTTVTNLQRASNKQMHLFNNYPVFIFGNIKMTIHITQASLRFIPDDLVGIARAMRESGSSSANVFHFLQKMVTDRGAEVTFDYNDVNNKFGNSASNEVSAPESLVPFLVGTLVD